MCIRDRLYEVSAKNVHRRKLLEKKSSNNIEEFDDIIRTQNKNKTTYATLRYKQHVRQIKALHALCEWQDTRLSDVDYQCVCIMIIFYMY